MQIQELESKLVPIVVFSNMMQTLMYMASGQRKMLEAPLSNLKTLRVPSKKKFIDVTYVGKKV